MRFLRYLLFTCSILFFVQLVNAQKDTIWYDSNWAVTTANDAAFFRPSPKPKDNGFWIEDFYTSGEKQMERFSKKQYREVFDGVVTWYDEKGKVSQKANYKDGHLHGLFVAYKDGKETTRLSYKEGKPQNGVRLYYNDTYHYYVHQEYTNGELIKELIYEGNPDTGLRIEVVNNRNENITISKFYNEKGEVLGKFSSHSKKTRNQKFYDGTYVDYYFNPMQVKSIVSFYKGSLTSKKVYYSSGELWENVDIKAGVAYITYYNKNGKKLGELTTNFNTGQSEYNLYQKPKNGTALKFNKSHDRYYVSHRNTYENGVKIKQEELYENGKPKAVTAYKKDSIYNSILRKETYSKEGKRLEKLSYKKGKPYNGTITKNYNHTETTYKQGIITSEIKRYKNGEIFKEEQNNQAIFYDKKGEKLGELEYRTDEYGNKKPENGDEIQLDHKEQIFAINGYKNGKRIKNMVFHKTTDLQEKLLKQKEVYYNENGRKTRSKDYYANGVIKSDIRFKGYANREQAIFYSPKGEELSKINYYPKKEGTTYTFFSQSDSVRSIKTYKQNKLVYEKNYSRNYRPTREDYDIYLKNEIDYNGKAAFYNEKEELIAQAVYKDGEPWQGNVVSGGANLYKILPYVNGKKEGEQIEYKNLRDQDPIVISKQQYREGQRDGAVYFYRDNGNLKRVKHYKNGKLEGKMIAYNEDGSEKNKLIYKNGEAQDGLQIKFKRGYGEKPDVTNKFYYENGSLIKEEQFKKNQEKEYLAKEISYNGNGLKGAEYDEAGGKTVTYNITDVNNKNGEIIYYNENGNQKEKGVLENGKPIKGVFYLDNFYGKYNLIPEDDQIKSVKLEIQGGITILSALDRNNQEIFLLKEHEKLKKSYLLNEIVESSYFYYDIL